MKWKLVALVSLAALCIFAVGLMFSGCDVSDPMEGTATGPVPELRDRPYDVDGIRVNGTESNSETGEIQRTFYFVDRFGEVQHNGPSPDGNYWTRQDAHNAKLEFDSRTDKE